MLQEGSVSASRGELPFYERRWPLCEGYRSPRQHRCISTQRPRESAYPPTNHCAATHRAGVFLSNHLEQPWTARVTLGEARPGGEEGKQEAESLCRASLCLGSFIKWTHRAVCLHAASGRSKITERSTSRVQIWASKNDVSVTETWSSAEFKWRATH